MFRRTAKQSPALTSSARVTVCVRASGATTRKMARVARVRQRAIVHPPTVPDGVYRGGNVQRGDSEVNCDWSEDKSAPRRTRSKRRKRNLPRFLRWDTQTY